MGGGGNGGARVETDFAIVRLQPSGRVDPGFGCGRVRTDFGPGTDDFATAAVLQRDRRIVAAGSSGVRGQPSNLALARYLNPLPPRCVVPNVRGKAIRAARRAIARARCRVGRVTLRTSKRVTKGRVVSQTPRPGARLPVGAKVTLAVSKGFS